MNATNQGTFIEIPHFTPKILYLILHSNQNYGDNSTTNLYQNQSNMPSKISIPLLVIEILNPWQGFIHGDKGVRLYRKTKNLGTTSKYIQIVITRKNWMTPNQLSSLMCGLTRAKDEGRKLSIWMNIFVGYTVSMGYCQSYHFAVLYYQKPLY